jgi:hypothetical protein
MEINKTEIIGILNSDPIQINDLVQISVKVEDDTILARAFGRLANILIKYLAKGDRVYLEGKMRQKCYESLMYLEIKNVIMLGGNKAKKKIKSLN